MRERRALPDKIAGAPVLSLGLELYWEAFWELSTCRNTGYSLGPIPWSAIRDYAQTFELDLEQTEDLFYLVRVMDQAYVEHNTPKEKKWQSPGHQKSSGGAWRSSQRPSKRTR